MIGIAELCFGKGVGPNIQSKGIDPSCFGLLHILVIVARAGSVIYDTDLGSELASFLEGWRKGKTLVP